MLSRLFIAALWSPARKGLTSWLLFVMFIVFFCYLPMWYPGSGTYLIISFQNLCSLSTFKARLSFIFNYLIILAHQIRISEILPWDRKSYFTHAILPRTSSKVVM